MPAFDLVQPALVDVVTFDLVVEMMEVKHVDARAFAEYT